MKDKLKQLKEAVDEATVILIIQSEVPDGDSLASSLALEGILSELKKEPLMHCAVQIPAHLSYLEGWDRVSDDIPDKFDLAIIVDTPTQSLLPRTFERARSRLVKKPLFVIDHHAGETDLPKEAVELSLNEAVSTGEAIYDIARELAWPLPKDAAKMLAVSILYDSLGLTTETTTAHSIHVLAELVEQGVSISELDEQRRAMMRRDADITAYKGQLIGRIKYELDGRLAYVHVPWEEIEEYSPRYNPAFLVLDEMRLTKGVELAVVFKTYPDGKLTAKLRASYGQPIARKIAEQFGGGGHDYAAGFKLIPGELDATINKLRQATLEALTNEAA